MTGLESVRLSSWSRDRLSLLKRRTGARQWNILCRWAFCLSLSEKSAPPRVEEVLDGNVEMSWRTFAGSSGSDFLWLALKARCARDGLGTDAATLSREFRLHLRRGIGYLSAAGKIKSLGNLVALGCAEK